MTSSGSGDVGLRVAISREGMFEAIVASNHLVGGLRRQ